MKLNIIFISIFLCLFTSNLVQSYPSSKEGNGGISVRVAGGKPAKPNQFPYQVGLSLRKLRGSTWCGGAIISNQIILTAGHCLFGSVQGTIYYGSVRQGGVYDENQIEVGYWSFVIHPKYNDTSLNSDIGLIKLPEPFKFSESINSVALPKSDIYEDGLNCVASGWGRLGDSSPATPRILQYVNLKLAPLDTCRSLYKEYLRPQHLCVDGSEKKSTCQGDSGGPLVTEVEGIKTIIGIVTYGHPDGCEKGHPTAYTRVYSYLDWIKKNSNL